MSGSVETPVMDNLQTLLEGGRVCDIAKLGQSSMVSSLRPDNHDFCSIMRFAQLSNRGNTFNTLHPLIVSTLKLEFKSFTELQEHLSSFGILINTSSSSEGSDTSITDCIFLKTNFVRNCKLPRDGSIFHFPQSSR